jgi:hypothetical protein
VTWKSGGCYYSFAEDDTGGHFEKWPYFAVKSPNVIKAHNCGHVPFSIGESSGSKALVLASTKGSHWHHKRDLAAAAQVAFSGARKEIAREILVRREFSANPKAP